MSWLWRKLTWSNSRQSWQERLAGVVLLAGGLGTWRYGSGLALWQQVVLWGMLLLATAMLLRRGWLKLFGPVFFYDLVRTARRGRYCFVRFNYTLILFLFFLLIYLDSPSSGRVRLAEMADFAASFFITFMMLQFAAVFLFTPPYAAGAITEEKECRTLEFLLATDLRNREIVLGKLAARLANLALLLLAGLPMLSLIQFLGGVDPELLLAGFAVTALTMASLASLSVLCSVYARKSLNALLLTYLIVAAYLMLSGLALAPLVAFPSVASFVVVEGDYGFTVEDLVDWCNAGNLVVALGKLADAWDRGRMLAAVLPELLLRYLIFHVLATLLCAGWAVARLRAVALKQSHGTTRKTRRLAWDRPAIGRWPMLWKEVFAEPGFRFGWLGYLGGALIAVISLAPAAIIMGAFFIDGLNRNLFDGPHISQDRWQRFTQNMNEWVTGVGTSLGCMMLVAVAIHAAGTVTSERARQTLDSLLTAPLSSRAILFGKLLGSILCLRWAWVWLGVLVAIGVGTSGLDVLAVPLLALAWLIYAVFFALVGLCCSTVCRTTLKSTLATLSTTALVTISPWVILSFFAVTMALLADVQPWEISSHDYELGALLSPPVTLACLSTYERVFGKAHEMAQPCAVLCLVGYAIVSVVLWEYTCRRFRRATNRDGGGFGAKRHGERRAEPTRVLPPPPLWGRVGVGGGDQHGAMTDPPP